MHIEKHIFIDFDAKDISESLLLKFVHNRLYDYEDTILKEHIYGEVEGLQDRAQQEDIRFTKREKLELVGISRIMNIKKAAYFRIIF